MAITFPRDMPSQCRITGEVPFVLVYQQSRGLAGGSPQVADLGPALWSGKWKIQLETPLEFGAWSAWVSTLRGGLRTFKGRPRRRWPLMHPRGFAGLTVGGAPFSGAGNLLTIGATRDTATLSQLPPGLKLVTGDHFSLAVGVRQHLHRITEGGTVGGPGTVAVSFEPPLHRNATTGTPVLLDAPWCTMIASADPSETAGMRGGSVTFDGIQVLI